ARSRDRRSAVGAQVSLDPEVGRGVGGRGSGPIPDRQSVGAARPERRVSLGDDRRAGPIVPDGPQARDLVTRGAPALLERARHAKALQTSYVSMPGAGARSQDESESVFPVSTTSWYFLDALDMRAPSDAYAIVAFGDSITDGTLSSLNGDDRWPDVLARRLHAV